ncbi:MAG TPA: ATP-binding protein [Polyangiaceae bacterium]|nr:ATP-binding protein [Polyangiaceae bacterium]
MTARSSKERRISTIRQGQAKRDDRIAELELSQRRLQSLYDISKLLTRFRTVERTVPEVVALLTQAVPLRSAIFILEAQPGAPRAIAWQAEGEGAARLQFARTHAQRAYRYLVRSSADLATDGTDPLPLPTPSTTPPAALEGNFVLLPFVVDHGAIFGALQVEGADKLNELELAFVNAVINQLAIAVDRQNLIGARHASAEAREKEQRLLAEVSARVGSSLEYRETLATLARSTVPEFADLCLIDAAGQEGDVHPREVVFADEKSQRDFADRLRQHPMQAGSRTMQATVLLSRKPVLFSRVPDPVAFGIAEEDEAAALTSAGVKSMMAVPLLSREKTLGVITFAITESGRRYSTHDLAVAEEIARRAAIAIDNARLYEQARRATLAREDLLAIVSHDLQSPLSVILLNLAKLLKEPLGEERRASRSQLATMQRSANRMCRLIEDLLATASIEAGRLSLKPQPVDVASLVSESLAALEPLAATKYLHLASELPADLPALQADGSRFLQILANLVGNAIKFTPAGGTITLGACAAAKEMTFSVADTGPGIAEDDLPHLFRRYWQSPRTARFGTGLGLFIVKGIVEAHGGKVWVESTVGKGTTFFFTLPLTSPANEALEKTGPASEHGIEHAPFLHVLPSEMARQAVEGPLPSTGEGLIEKLAREVKHRNLELHTAVESARVARELAERAGEFRRDFMSVVSHELRGPLTALELLIERLQRAEEGPPTPQQQQIIGRMFAAVARLTTIVESLLQHALIQSGRLTTQIDAVDAGAVAASVVEELRPYAEEKSLDLRFVTADGLPLLRNDSLLVRLILLNLVGNAIKFTERGQVEIAIDCKGGKHHFTIKDSGAGIPAAARVRIFEPFSPRGDARQKHVPGMGLGLTLVREIASALGGTLELDSEIGVGSTFTVTLPSLAQTSRVETPPLPVDHQRDDQ